MKVCVDIDGCIDSNPREFQSIMSSLKACGHTVVVLTGSQNGAPSAADQKEKAAYLQKLGCGACYDQLVVLDGTDQDALPQVKADWCKKNNVDVLVDNTKANAKAAQSVVPLVLVPWASRQ